MNTKGNFSLFVLLLMSLGVLVAAIIVSQIGSGMTSKIYQTMEPFIQSQVNETYNLSDQNVAAAVRTAYQGSVDSSTTNIEFFQTFYQYSWLIFLIIVGLIFLLRSRQITQTGVGY